MELRRCLIPCVAGALVFVLGAFACGSSDPAPAAAPGPGAEGGPGGQDGSGPVGPDPSQSQFHYVDFDINHVLITGQSNSVSNQGIPVLTKDQPFANIMFDTGVMPATDCDGEGCKTYEEPKAFLPLVEGDHYFSYVVETCASSLANQITHLATKKHMRPKHDVLANVDGRSGNTYQCLRKGGCNYKPGYVEPFGQAIKDVTKAGVLAKAQGKSYIVRAVVAIHGESDHYSYGTNTQEFPMDGTDGTKGAVKDYSDGVVEWQKDFEASIKDVTKQTEAIPLLISQISGWNDGPESRVAQWQLDAHTRAAGKVILVTPAYPIPLSQEDCLHYTNEGERRLGEYFAKAYSQIVFEGKPWEPLRPKNVTRDGAVITVSFVVPKPPLVFDTMKVAAAENMGFGFSDGSGSAPAIKSVELAGPETVKITLAAAPAGADKRLKYAMNQTKEECIGNPRGARGNLRDSDDTPSRLGYDLQNWSVHFNVPVP